MSAGCCLQKVSVLLKNEVMTTVFGFVSQHVQSTEWKMRYAALIALGAIIEGPDREKFKQTLLPGLENLLKMFQD
jgi:importin subunit beta-1